MHGYRLIAAVGMIALAMWIIVSPQFIREKFAEVVAANDSISYSNKGTEPWKHHPIVSSVPVDIVTKSDKPYYYEFDNAQYDIAISKTFEYPCKLAPELLNNNFWAIVDLTEDSPVRSGAMIAYQKALNFISNKLNTSEYMQLPYDNPSKRPKIQVVHDVLTQAKIHKNNANKYILNVEVVIYREAKYNGKHVSMTIMADYKPYTKTWNFNILEINVLGVVYEDNIGLFPVVANYVEPVAGADFDVLLDDKVVFPDNVVNDVVKKQKNASERYRATQEAVNSK